MIRQIGVKLKQHSGDKIVIHDKFKFNRDTMILRTK